MEKGPSKRPLSKGKVTWINNISAIYQRNNLHSRPDELLSHLSLFVKCIERLGKRNILCIVFDWFSELEILIFIRFLKRQSWKCLLTALLSPSPISNQREVILHFSWEPSMSQICHHIIWHVHQRKMACEKPRSWMQGQNLGGPWNWLFQHWGWGNHDWGQRTRARSWKSSNDIISD